MNRRQFLGEIWGNFGKPIKNAVVDLSSYTPGTKQNEETATVFENGIKFEMAAQGLPQQPFDGPRWLGGLLAFGGVAAGVSAVIAAIGNPDLLHQTLPGFAPDVSNKFPWTSFPANERANWQELLNVFPVGRLRVNSGVPPFENVQAPATLVFSELPSDTADGFFLATTMVAGAIETGAEALGAQRLNGDRRNALSLTTGQEYLTDNGLLHAHYLNTPGILDALTRSSLDQSRKLVDGHVVFDVAYPPKDERRTVSPTVTEAVHAQLPAMVEVTSEWLEKHHVLTQTAEFIHIGSGALGKMKVEVQNEQIQALQSDFLDGIIVVKSRDEYVRAVRALNGVSVEASRELQRSLEATLRERVGNEIALPEHFGDIAIVFEQTVNKGRGEIEVIRFIKWWRAGEVPH